VSTQEIRISFIDQLPTSNVFRRVHIMQGSKLSKTKTLVETWRLVQPGGPTARVSALPFLPEDIRRSSFRNVVILLKYRRWTKSKKQLLQIITHHRQNLLDVRLVP
jgi:hypothetical protein